MFDTEDKTKDFLIHKGSDKLTIAFAGLHTGLCEVRHDFFNATSGMDCSKIYVKDRKELWYQQGINEEINSIPLLVSKLKETIDRLNPSTITCIGISAGGYAAQLFGSLLGVNRVESFGPQTFLSPKIAKEMGIGSWLETEFQPLYESIQDKTYWNLKDFIGLSQKTKHIVHVCNLHKEDMIHARWISEFDNVTIKEYGCDEHAPASFLKRFNKLIDVLEGKEYV